MTHGVPTATHRRALTATGFGIALALGVGACSSAATPTTNPSAAAGSATTPAGAGAASQTPVPVESNPPGDIPDNIAFVPYSNAAAGYSFTHPEGWARTESGAMVTFTDKLNGIVADTTAIPGTIDESTAKADEVPRLQGSQPAFQLSSIKPATLPAGTGIEIVYQANSAADPVTGRQVRDEVHEFLVSNGTRSVRLTLSGPVGADNVDAYRTITESLTL